MRRYAKLPMVLWALSCGKADPVQPNASPSHAADPSRDLPRVLAIQQAELTRDSSQIEETDLSSREVVVRRGAARALARIADQRSADLLLETLADEDPDVVAWSAYGLGHVCPMNEPKSTRAVVARAASWWWEAPKTQGTLDVDLAFAEALARCGTRTAETTLRGWLSGPAPRAEAAAIALGKLAALRGRLEDASVVALLDAADRREQSLKNALLAFSHLEGLSESVQRHVLTVATMELKRKGTQRILAIRALGLGGAEAAPALLDILTNPRSDGTDRAEAARQLARLGAPGQAALAQALPRLIPARVERATLVSAGWPPLAAALAALDGTSREAAGALTHLAELEVPRGAATAVRRRIVWLRCTAASRLADASLQDARLLACDPEKNGRQGQLSMIEVLDRGRIEQGRYLRWRTLATSNDAIVREAALRLMGTHPEIEKPYEVLAKALDARADGVVATAGQVLASFPDRAGERDAEDRAVRPGGANQARGTVPDAELVRALGRALSRSSLPEAIQRHAALLDAASALQLLSLKPELAKACTSGYPVLRERAERGLQLLGERRRQCPAPKPQRAVEGLPRATPPTRLTFNTDAGSVVIDVDPQTAPLAAQQIVELARGGFYNGTVIHRAVPGFIVQFGDPSGDGFGGARRNLLPCEAGPLAFTARTVGVAISGKDTGSSQLFVVLGPYPHLDGDFTRLGTASGNWEQLMVGDVIRTVSVSAL